MLSTVECKESSRERLDGVGGYLLVALDSLDCMSEISAIPNSV